MQGLLLGATIVLVFIVGVLAASAAHAEGPRTTEEEALTQLMLARAPLAAEPLSAASTSGSVTSSTLPSSIASPPSAPPLAPAAETVLPPQLGAPAAAPPPGIPIAKVMETAGGTAPALLVAYLTTAGRLEHAGALGEVWRTADGGGRQTWW